MISWSYSRSRRTASIRSGRAGGLAGELAAGSSNPGHETRCEFPQSREDGFWRHPRLGEELQLARMMQSLKLATEPNKELLPFGFRVQTPTRKGQVGVCPVRRERREMDAKRDRVLVDSLTASTRENITLWNVLVPPPRFVCSSQYASAC
jgi:hypothetical protein